MIIIRVMGGLGNQLQQYALYRKFGSLGIAAKLDVSWFSADIQAQMRAPRPLELCRFEDLPMETANTDEVRALLGRTYEERAGITERIRRRLAPGTLPVFEESKMFHEEIFSLRDRYLVGYFACEAYYADILKMLQKEIRFPKSDNPGNRETMEEMQTQTAVSIHVRRGDYLDAVNAANFGGICTDEYYDRAIDYIKERFPEAVFYIFSDDTDYVRARFQGQEYRIVDWNRGKDSFYDMQLMSCCRHNICANSTFSFWGARLNPHDGKCMIRPSIHRNTQICPPQELQKLWRAWTLITPGGEVV